jgi:hypothetical protein
MRPILIILLALIVGCPNLTPFGGDDDDAGDDDDVGDDDVADDDDSTGDDDDSGPPPCTNPPNVVPTVVLTDPSGAVTTSFSVGNPLTITVDLENIGGGTETAVYGSQCLFNTSVWNPAGEPQGGERSCSSGVLVIDYICGDPPTTDVFTLEAVQTPSGVPLESGTYELQVFTYDYGTIVLTVTVP